MSQNVKNKIEAIIGNQNIDERAMLEQLKNLLHETESKNSLARNSKSIAELVADNIRRIQENENQSHVIKSGFDSFDNLFGGFGLGELVVIGARPSMGKTQLLVNLALNISSSTPVLYFTFDLSASLLTHRFISALTGIAVNNLLQQKLTDEQKERLSTLEATFANHKILVNDSCNNAIPTFKSLCEKQIKENGVKVIVVDYLQMMSSSRFVDSRDLEISYIIRELKSLAKDFNVCVIATSQLNRAVELRGGDKRPQLSDLRESGAIEQDADKVLFIYRPEYYGFMQDEYGNSTQGLVELIVAKNRTGHLGSIYFKRNATLSAYEPYDEPQHQFNFSPNRLDELKENTDPSPPF